MGSRSPKACIFTAGGTLHNNHPQIVQQPVGSIHTSRWLLCCPLCWALSNHLYAALAFLGGLAGVPGGIAVVGLTGLIADALTTLGPEDLLTAIYSHRRLSEPQGKL